MIERITELLHKNGLSQNDFCRKIDIPSSTFRTWKKGACPSADNLYKVAQYFGVSVEYLLTGNNSPATQLNDKETELLNNYRSINQERQGILLKISRCLSGVE